MADDDSTTEADDTATGADQDSTTSTETTDELGDAGRRALAEERRARKVAERELANLRKAAMSDQERAVAEAKAAGLAEAARAAAPRLVKAELRAAAADAGLPREALAGFLEYADLGRFVGEDGQVDEKAIGAAIKKLGGGKPADFDGGARTPALKGNDMNSVIRRAAGVI
jgi:hypothetical protein